MAQPPNPFEQQSPIPGVKRIIAIASGKALRVVRISFCSKIRNMVETEVYARALSFGNSAITSATEPSPSFQRIVINSSSVSVSSFASVVFVFFIKSAKRSCNGPWKDHETRDIVLSFRQQWAGTGPYPQIQLGISHSTLAYRDDEGRIRNLDMPLNEEMMEDSVEKGPSYFSSPLHFRKLDAMHVLRPRITDKQRETVNEWAKIFAEGARTGYAKNRGAFYPNKIGFNTDYLNPLIRGDQPNQYGFYAHNLARIALGYSNISPKSFQMFCSEFLWSILSLRDCDPVANKKDFASNTTAACVKPFYDPVNLLGDYPTNTSSPTSDVGGADGPLLILKDFNSPNIQADIDQIFAPSTKGEDMSQGHKAVTASIPAALFTGQTDRAIESYKLTLVYDSKSPTVHFKLAVYH